MAALLLMMLAAPLWVPPVTAEGMPAAGILIHPADGGLPDYAQRLEAIVDAYPRLPTILADVFAHPNGAQPAISPLRLGYGLALLFAAGALALILARRLLRRQETAAPVPRLMAGLAEIAAFSLGTLLAFALMRPPHPAAPAILLAVLKLVATLLLTDRILRILTAPGDPAHRLLPLDTPAARGLQNTAMIVVVLTAGPLGLLDLLRALGLPQDAAVALGLPMGTLPFLYLLWVIWRHHVAVMRTLIEPLNLDARSLPLLAIWPALATLHLLGLWFAAAGAALRLEPQTGQKLLASLLLAFGVPLVALVLMRPLSRLYRGDSRDLGAPDNSDPQVARLMRAVLLALIVLGVVGTAMIWGSGLTVPMDRALS